MQRIAGKSVGDIFKSIDKNNDNAIDKNEVGQMSDRLKVDSLAKGKVSDQFFDNFDSNKDGKIKWDEFTSKAATLIPKEAKDRHGNIDTDKMEKTINDTIKDVDSNRDGSLSAKEIYAKVHAENAPTGLNRLNPIAHKTAEVTADTAAKLSTGLLDANGDGKLSKDEIMTTAKSAVEELNKANNAPNS